MKTNKDLTLLLVTAMLPLFSVPLRAARTDVLVADTIPAEREDTVGTRLGEATVTATRLLFVTKKDTVVYDLDALVTTKGDMLGDIVRKMPGLELRDGTLYFKGEPVSRLMVNGTDFSRGDLSKALDNLPAYIIKHVKAYRRKSDEAMRTGIDDGVREQVVDVILRREYMGTWTGNADAGYGTDRYWRLRGFANTFTDNWRVSAYLGMTNTGEFQSVSSSSGQWNNNGAGASSGYTTYKYPGASFFWQNHGRQKEAGWVKVDGSVDWDYRRHNDFYANNQETFLENGSTFNASRSDNDNWEKIWWINLALEWNLTDSTYLQYRPSLDFRSWDAIRDGVSGQWNADPFAFGASPLDSLFATGDPQPWPADGSTVYTTRRHSTDHDQSTGYSHWFYLTHKLTADNMRLSLRQQLSYHKGSEWENSLTEYRYFLTQPGSQEPLINRRSEGRSHSFSQMTFLDYFVPIGKYLTGRATYGNTTNDSFRDVDGYRLDSLGGVYANYADYLLEFGRLPTEADWRAAVHEAASTLYSDDHVQKHWAEIRFQFNNKKGLYAHLQSTLRFANERMDYMRGLDTPLPMRRDFREFFINSQVRYETDSIGRFNLQYNYDTGTPGMLSMVTIPNTEDPLNIVLGNPDLKQSHSHTVQFQYDISLPKMRYVAWSLYWLTTKDATTQRSTYDPETGVTTQQTVNVDGNWHFHSSLNFNTPLDRKQRLSLTTALTYNLNRVVGYALATDGLPLRYTTKNHSLYAQATLSYRLDRLFVQLGGTWNYIKLRSNYASANNLNLCSGYYNWNVEWKMPWDMELKSALRVTQYMGDVAENFDPWQWIWNASLAKSFLRDKSLTLMLEGSDLLNQRSQRGFSMSSTGNEEWFARTVGRFAMLHVIYRFSTKPKGKS